MTIDALPDRLTHQEAPDVVRRLAASLGSASANAGTAQPWALDASALKHFDSSALAVLLECRRLAGSRGRALQITDAPAKLAQLARLYGLDDLLVMAGDDADRKALPQD